MGRKEDSKGRYPIVPRRAITKSVVHCPDCLEPYVVYRGIKKSRSYQGGHVKDLWCYKCLKVQKFIQANHDVSKYNY
jgi:hypothetical protein